MKYFSLAPVALLLISACATLPSGPSVMVLPGSGKTFDQFRIDDADCRTFAQQQIGGGTPNQAVADTTTRSAAVGTILGAVAGGAVDGSNGAAAGAGIGLLTGALVGTGEGSAYGYSLQQRYDIGYVQCMYMKGDKVPGVNHPTTSRYRSYSPLPPGAPPPPSGRPPPPPPDY